MSAKALSLSILLVLALAACRREPPLPRPRRCPGRPSRSPPGPSPPRTPRRCERSTAPHRATSRRSSPRTGRCWPPPPRTAYAASGRCSRKGRARGHGRPSPPGAAAPRGPGGGEPSLPEPATIAVARERGICPAAVARVAWPHGPQRHQRPLPRPGIAMRQASKARPERGEWESVLPQSGCPWSSTDSRSLRSEPVI